MSNYRVGGDVGGTFTDVVMAGEDGSLALKKVLSTPGRFERAMVDGVADLLREQGVGPDEVVEVLHGTTAATNAVLQRLGAVTGLITTRGFRDVLELRRLRMPNIYDIFWDKPAPLAPRNLCREVTERLNGMGEVLTGLDPDEVRRVVRSLLEDGVTSLAVCLLHSYINPVHEREIAEIVRREFPDLYLSVSSEVLPEIREYERTSTVVTNAYIMPVMASYLNSMTQELARMGVRAPLLIVKSSGGMMTARMAVQAPIHSLESGPAAGVRASLALARRLGIKDVVTLDMGGTTAKGSLIENGEAHRASEYEVGAPISTSSRLLKGGGYLLRIRAIDLAEVGAGGGSIVAIDSGGSLQVGPQSAGAAPGPVCYDGGGDQPTVTDANLVLGYLNQEYLLGGSLKVNREKAHRVLDEAVAKPLDLPLLEAAYAVHMVSNASMARIIRAVTTERGRDIRNFDLIAFGGNGPVHAAELARSLGIRRIIVPPVPGLFSALGLLVSPLEQEEVQTIMRPTASLNDADLERLYAGLEQQVAAALRDEGVDLSKVEYSPMADMRSIDQAHELTVAAPVGPSNGQRIGALEESFWQEHQRSFGHRSDSDPTEIVNVRLVARYATAREGLNVSVDSLQALYRSSPGKTARLAYFGRESGSLETPVVARLDLSERATPGPLIVEEYDTTVVVPPGVAVRRDPLGNLLLE